MPTQPQSVLVLDDPKRVPGLIAAAVVGCALVSAGPFLMALAAKVWSLLTAGSAPSPTAAHADSAVIWGAFYIPLLVGELPVALAFCFIFGYPAWVVASENGLKRRHHALGIGALFGTILYGAWELPSLAKLGNQLYGSGADWQAAAITILVVLYGSATGAAAGLAAWCAGGSKKRAPKTDTLP